MKYREEINSEWFRLLNVAGLTVKKYNEAEATFYRDGDEVGRLDDDDALLIRQGYRELMNKVSALRENVKEYVTAYCEAPNLTATDLPNGYRKLSDLGRCVFAAKQMRDSSYEFVTWEYSFDKKSVTHGNYFREYEAAKADFGVRIGMIDRSKLFSETEIIFLYKHLSHYLDLNNYISCDDENKIKSLLDKMKDIAPECISEYLSSTEPDNDFEEEHE